MAEPSAHDPPARDHDRHARALAALREVSETLYRPTSVSDILRAALQIVANAVDAEAGSILLHDPESDRLVLRHVIGPVAERIRNLPIEPESIAGTVFHSGEPLLIPDVAADPRHGQAVDAITGFVTRSLVAVPLKRMAGAPLGAIELLNKRDGPFDEADLEVLITLAAVVAALIEHVRLTEEARLARAIRLAGDISHDLKNLMAPIPMAVDTLRLTLDQALEMLSPELRQVQATDPPLAEALRAGIAGLRDQCRELLDILVDSSHGTQEHVRQIADAVKGVITPPKFEPSDIAPVVDQVVRALRPLADERGVALVVDLPDDGLTWTFDRWRLFNALYNLMNNAIPETPAGGTVTVRARRITHPDFPDGCVRLEVTDTGRGIPPEILEKLFTDEVVSTKPGGSGLGTRIAHDAVRVHGGTIRAASVVGQGTTITCLFPVTPIPPEEQPRGRSD